ncbi:MAG: hypothetical protein WCG06_05790 [Candidatus Omnitrophota bacterium]
MQWKRQKCLDSRFRGNDSQKSIGEDCLRVTADGAPIGAEARRLEKMFDRRDNAPSTDGDGPPAGPAGNTERQDPSNLLDLQTKIYSI